MVSDPAMDGWATGIPDYRGDFFTPGQQWEGWTIQADGRPTATANSTSCDFTGGLSGGFVSYSAAGSTVSGRWEGLMDSLVIRKVITMDTSALYFYSRVIITNISSIAHNNIYYMRALKPDNTQSWAGG